MNGCGIAYELTPNRNGWEGAVIHQFAGPPNDGQNPYGGLISDAGGDLYGVTEVGGAYGQGTVYELSLSGSAWTETILHNFFANTNDGGYPVGGLVIDTAGNLYGGTKGGGAKARVLPLD